MSGAGGQLDLFATDQVAAEKERARRRRDDGMQRVEDHADDDWKLEAWRTLLAYLRSHHEFFVDDFWRDTGLDVPREARALGPLVQRAARMRFIERTGRSRPSVRSNMTDKPVWRSLLWEGAEAS